MTTPNDRFDAYTGQPIQPIQPTFAPTPLPPAVSQEPIQRPTPVSSVAQRIREKNHARRGAMVSVLLPDFGETVQVLRRPFADILSEVGFPPFLSKQSQADLMAAVRSIDGLSAEALAGVSQSTATLVETIGMSGALDLQRLLLYVYPLGCLVTPRCVPTEVDITDETNQIALDWLTPADRNAIYNAAQVETAATAAPDQGAA